MDQLPSCSCCGVPEWKHELWGHDKECIWYEAEMYKLLQKWVEEPECVCGLLKGTWKPRFDIAVTFLLDQIKHIKQNQSNQVKID